jgi:predicted RNA-binding protein with PUA-like domain
MMSRYFFLPSLALKPMKYWLFKSEPTTFNIDDLSRAPKQTTNWEGVRNYQVRNMLRDDISVGDKVFFYHSNCNPPGIVGIMEVIKAGYPDESAYDSKSKYYDPKSLPTKPLWYQVDVRFIKKLPRCIALDELKKYAALKNMPLLRKGNRLSITPLVKEEWEFILHL